MKFSCYYLSVFILSVLVLEHTEGAPKNSKSASRSIFNLSQSKSKSKSSKGSKSSKSSGAFSTLGDLAEDLGEACQEVQDAITGGLATIDSFTSQIELQRTVVTAAVGALATIGVLDLDELRTQLDLLLDEVSTLSDLQNAVTTAQTGISDGQARLEELQTQFEDFVGGFNNTDIVVAVLPDVLDPCVELLGLDE